MEFSSKAFKEGKCQGQKVVHGEIMPLVLQPPEPNKGDLESLLFALKENKDWFEQMIINNSAVLLRGYNVEKAEDFNEIIEIFGWEEIHYVGPAPRTHVYKRVLTANEGPLSQFIYFHHEMVLVGHTYIYDSLRKGVLVKSDSFLPLNSYRIYLLYLAKFEPMALLRVDCFRLLS